MEGTYRAQQLAAEPMSTLNVVITLYVRPDADSQRDHLQEDPTVDTVGRNSVSHRDTLLAVFARVNG